MNDKEPCTYRGVVSIGDKLYIATLGKGLFCFDKQSETFSSFVDVGCNLINKLSTDGKDLLYLSTDGEGVAFVSVKQKRWYVLSATILRMEKACTPIPCIPYCSIVTDGYG